MFSFVADIAIIAGVILFVQWLYYRYHDESQEYRHWKYHQKIQERAEQAALKNDPNVIDFCKRRKAK